MQNDAPTPDEIAAATAVLAAAAAAPKITPADLVRVAQVANDALNMARDSAQQLDTFVAALNTATPSAVAKVRRTVAATTPAGKRGADPMLESPFYKTLLAHYPEGREVEAGALLLSPPALGKSYAIRHLGTKSGRYDLYLEHGCSNDLNEIAKLCGGHVPDGRGGWVTVDGLITQAFRSAANHQRTLFCADEILRWPERVQNWILTTLVPHFSADGSYYQLTTERAVPAAARAQAEATGELAGLPTVSHDGGIYTLEVLRAPTSLLHFVSAANLSNAPVIEAFWSRWEKYRFDYTQELGKNAAAMILAKAGVTDKHLSLAAIAATITGESRKLVGEAALRFPVDMRHVSRAIGFLKNAQPEDAPAPTRSAVARRMAERLADAVAAWDEIGDADANSVACVVSMVSRLYDLAAKDETKDAATATATPAEAV